MEDADNADYNEYDDDDDDARDDDPGHDTVNVDDDDDDDVGLSMMMSILERRTTMYTMRMVTMTISMFKSLSLMVMRYNSKTM